MRIVFMGSPDFSVPCLKALLDSEHEVVAVYSQPPRAAGRGKKERLTPVHAAAQDAGLEVRTPLNFKDPKDVADFEALNADLAVVIAYGLILPQSILDAPRYGCVNLHASLLPRWRGAAPIHRAIMAGDAHTGVCLMRMTLGLDEGPVYAREAVEIPFGMTTGVLHNVLANLSAEVLMENMDKVHNVYPTPQRQDGVTYAHKIEKAEAEIDWTKPAIEVAQQIHGLSPFPGAWSSYAGERLKFHQVEINDQSGEAGTIADETFAVYCGTQAIRPLVIQREGKRAMPAGDVLRGLKFSIDEKLGEGT